MLYNAPISSNGTLRCYNMFPSHFKNIEEMTAYLTHVKALGMNAVWINPIHLTGQFKLQKADMLTGQTQHLKGSIYAMTDSTLVDPRFSMVKRDPQGDVILSDSQISTLKNYSESVLEQIKRYRAKVNSAQEKLAKYNKLLSKFQAKQKGSAVSTISTEATIISTEEKSIRNKAKALELKLTGYELSYAKYNNLQLDWIKKVDGNAMKAFTRQAKALGLTPMFDLVFNHLSSEATFIKENPELFNINDRTYPDATAFSYSKLLGSKRSAQLSELETQQTLAQIPVIIDRFWRPFINQYVTEWGFCGVRVDCVRKVPKELRAPIYDLIRQEVAKQKDPAPVVILEEALFSDLSTQEFVDIVQGAGATHITGSSYYANREWHGGLNSDYNTEDFLKKSMVQNGVVNFTGNHDHFTCAMTVCRELAFERLKENTELYNTYLNHIREREKLNGGALAQTVIDLIKTLFIHFYVTQIINELKNPDQYNETVLHFGKAYRDKIITNAYSGSGGYFLFSGDEYASFHQPTVFLRNNGESVYPNLQLSIFNSSLKDMAYAVINEMAAQAIKGKKYNLLFSKLSADNQIRFASSFAQQIFNEINTNVENTVDRFWSILAKKAKQANIKISDDLLNEENNAAAVTNQWHAIKCLQPFCSTNFFIAINNILEKLPASNHGFWSEQFKTSNNNILISVRFNGVGYAVPVDIVVHNLDPNNLIRLEKQDFEKIGMWLQKRAFPKVEDLNSAPIDFHKAYGSIMGSSEYQQRPANLYFAGKLELDQDIAGHRVNINSVPVGFTIVVAPKPAEIDPLLAQGPEQYAPESRSKKEILSMFKDLSLRNSQSSWNNDSPYSSSEEELAEKKQVDDSYDPYSSSEEELAEKKQADDSYDPYNTSDDEGSYNEYTSSGSSKNNSDDDLFDESILSGRLIFKA